MPLWEGHYSNLLGERCAPKAALLRESRSWYEKSLTPCGRNRAWPREILSVVIIPRLPSGRN